MTWSRIHVTKLRYSSPLAAVYREDDLGVVHSFIVVDNFHRALQCVKGDEPDGNDPPSKPAGNNS